MTRRDFFGWTAALSAPSEWFAQVNAFRGQAKLNQILDACLEGQWRRAPIGELVAHVGKAFLGTPYVASTLEVDVNREYCVVNLDGLDCVTFFETSLAIARAVKLWASFERPSTMRPTSQDVLRETTLTRYRGGKVDGYASRLHYTLDWMRDNAAKRTVALPLDGARGSTPLRKTFDFMSKRPELYQQLAHNPERVKAIQLCEASLNQAKFSYVPTANARSMEAHLLSGDIIGLVMARDGLDISHTGLIVREGDRALFMHASSTDKKVKLDVRLSDVLQGSKTNIGFVVARPLEP